jgi:hypothetical protein
MERQRTPHTPETEDVGRFALELLTLEEVVDRIFEESDREVFRILNRILEETR